jgi:sigma-B regulation protein RsbU (phosphoserine phosphatase)
VTLFLARLNMHEHRLEYCNAGHVPPLYWDTTGNEIKKLRQGGTLVGQFPGLTYDQGELTLNRGDRLFAFTDGLTEAEDIHRGFFGIERVMQVFLAEKELPAARFCTRVKEWVDRFREGAGEETIDDFTLFLMKIL